MSKMNHPIEKMPEPLRGEVVSSVILKAVPTEEPSNFSITERISASQALAKWRRSLPQRGSIDARGNGRQLLNCTHKMEGGGCVSESFPNTEAGNPTFSLWLELVEVCNLDCLFCYNPWRPHGNTQAPLLSTNQLLDVISTLFSRLDIAYVTLAGGEPLMRQDLIQIIEHLRSWSAPVGMATNGRSATRNLLQRYRSAGLAQIAVPIHSHEPAVHDRLTGAKSWHSAVRALAIAQELGYFATMSTVITRLNSQHIGRLCEIVDLLGLDHYVLNCFHPVGQGSLNTDTLVPFRLEFDQALGEARDHLGSRAIVDVGSPPVSSTIGLNQINRVVLSPTGDLKFCVQSNRGAVNLVTNDHESIDQVLALLGSGNHQELINSVDNCTCRGDSY
ncbi:radical SAM protein [Crossiella sp. S99.1]|uniref:radical SAM protein n=1 Tax=Crossiella sp. S99.1 TaxID=2936271 RepID=UPI001FFE3D34|nr:radical SAM protein [Crossiella sp. S99.1]MCK2258297.1 radical SAM protein [Crossiella sp. S99.1]